MSWNYRVVRDKNKLLSIREVYYDKKDRITGYCDPEKIDGFESLADLRTALSMMLKDSKRKLLNEADLPGGEK